MTRIQGIRLSALLAVHAAVVGLVFASWDDVPEWIVTAWLGWIVGQITLVSTWAALAPWQEGLLRIAVGLVLLTLLWFSMVFWLQVFDSWFIPEIAMVWAAMGLWAFVLVYAAVRFGSWLFRWRLSLTRANPNGKVGTGQFRIAHVLTATAGVAILLGLGRIALPVEGWNIPSLSGEILGVAGIMALCVFVNTLAFVPVGLWSTSLGNDMLAAMLFGFPFYIAIVTLLEISVFLAFGESPSEPEVAMHFSFNLVQGICFIASFHMLRWAGWKMIRVSQGTAKA